MTAPDSLLTRFRFWAVQHLEPRPDPGEAWCMNCRLNGGRTRVLGADSPRAHAEEHLEARRENLAADVITIISRKEVTP